MSLEWQLPLRQVPGTNARANDTVVWNRLRLCYEQKLFGQITSVAYNHQGTQVGCTSSHQFALLRVPQTDGVVVNEQSDRSLFSISFREDDKLFIQCVEKRISVKSPDTAFERQFLGHSRDVHCASFLGSHNFVSGSDDTTIKLWDLLRDTELMTGNTHTDYVRSLVPFNSGCFFSGSYDHTVQLWDPRTSFSKALQHSGDSLGQIVETMCFIPELNTLACGAGDQLVLFDTRKGISSPLSKTSCHSKTITSVAYSSEYKTVITGSLDGRLKMHSLSAQLECLSTKRLSDPIAAVALHPLSHEFCVGSTTGEIQIFKIDSNTKENEIIPEGIEVDQSSRSKEVLASKMRTVQHQLRTFNYHKALMSALYSRNSDVIMSALEELIKRGALHVALSNQNDRTIAQILRFAVAHVDRPQFSSDLFEVLEDIFEIYGTSVGTSLFLHREMLIARKRIGLALETINKMEKMQGIMELIVNGGSDSNGI